MGLILNMTFCRYPVEIKSIDFVVMAQFWINIAEMKKILYIHIPLLLIWISFVKAQDGKPQPVGTGTVQAIPYPNAPEITFEKSEHDFGTLKKGQPVTYKFKFTNTGKEDLIISNCRAGCDCTTAKCSKDPIKPGKSSYIEVHYDSTRVGKFGKEVMIYSNARKPVVFLVIRGNIEDPNVPAIKEEPAKTPVPNKSE